MGYVTSFTKKAFPKQGSHFGKRALVVLQSDSTNEVAGEVVRDDMEMPFLTVIRLDDGRHVMANECMYKTI